MGTIVMAMLGVVMFYNIKMYAEVKKIAKSVSDFSVIAGYEKRNS